MQASSYRVNQQLPSCADDQKDQDRLAIAPPNRCAFLSSCQYPRSIAQGLISHLALKLTLLLELQTCTSIQAPHRIFQQRRNNGLQKGLCWGGEKSQRLTESRQHSSSPTHALILLKLRFLPLTSTTWLLLLQTIELQLEVGGVGGDITTREQIPELEKINTAASLQRSSETFSVCRRWFYPSRQHFTLK